jgi:dTDP-4-dehydrorhamnose reductase
MTSRTIDFAVTGASGQLGREFCEYFEKNGVSYKAFDSGSLDITDKTAVTDTLSLYKPKVLLNCAAYTKVDLAEDDAASCYKVNDEAVHLLAEACRENDILLIHFSTDYVFAGNKEDSNQYLSGYTPDVTGKPTGIYASSKWAGEQRIRQSGCKYLIIRVSWLCGRYGHNFVKTMLRLGHEKDTLNVVDDQIGSPTFTKQVLEQTMALVHNNINGTFHVTSDGVISWYDLAAEIMKIAGLTCKIQPVPTSGYPTRARRPLFSKLNTASTSACTGLPMGDWKMHLNKLIQSLNSNNAAY